MKGELSTHPVDSLFTPRRFALFLAALLFANFPEVFLGTHTFYFRDYLTIAFPNAQYNHDTFWRGELPLWNPLNHCGIPFLAQWQTSTLYPGWWIFLPFAPSLSLGLFTLLHLFMGGMTMFYFARRWSGSQIGGCVAGIIYTFNGLTQNSLTWPAIIAVLAWAPLVILLVERAWKEGGRTIITAVFAGAMQMLAGAPEQTLFTWLILLLMAAQECLLHKTTAWLTIRRLVFVIILIALLSAAQLLPFLDLLSQSQRSAAFASSQGAQPGGATWAVPGWGWANLLVPMFYNFQTPSGVYFQSSQFFTSSYYLGAGSLLFALWAACRRRNSHSLLPGILLLVSLVLSLGEHTPVYSLLQTLFPFIGFMRYPVKFMYLAVLVLPLLAANGIAGIQTASESERRRELQRLVILVLAFVAFIGAIAWFARMFPLYPALGKNWPVVWQSAWTRIALLLLAGGAAAIWLRSVQSRTQILAGVTLIIAFWLDLHTHLRPTPNPTVPRWAMTPGVVKLDQPPRPGEARAFVTLNSQLKFLGYQSPIATNDVLFNRLILLHQCNLIDGLPVVGGAHTLLIPESDRVAGLLLSTNDFLPRGIADFLGVSHVSDETKLEWKKRESPLPMVTAGQRPIFVDATTTFASLANPAFNPRQTVYLPVEARSAAKNTNASATRILSSRFGSHQIDLETESDTGGWVVLAQSYHHNWQARIDDQSTTLWKANYGFQALEVPAGRHRVEITYRDRMFLTGTVLSLSTLLACALFWWRCRDKSASLETTTASAV